MGIIASARRRIKESACNIYYAVGRGVRSSMSLAALDDSCRVSFWLHNLEN